MEQLIEKLMEMVGKNMDDTIKLTILVKELTERIKKLEEKNG